LEATVLLLAGDDGHLSQEDRSRCRVKCTQVRLTKYGEEGRGREVAGVSLRVSSGVDRKQGNTLGSNVDLRV
jgi:hypothetical protein